jgi:hypothetical protein
MALLILAIPMGVILGFATWALIRGRGGFIGALLCMFFATVGALIGALATDALAEGASRGMVALGSGIGAILASVIEAVAFGPRPKRVAWADQKGVAVEQPDDGSVPKSLV